MPQHLIGVSIDYFPHGVVLGYIWTDSLAKFQLSKPRVLESNSVSVEVLLDARSKRHKNILKTFRFSYLHVQNKSDEATQLLYFDVVILVKDPVFLIIIVCRSDFIQLNRRQEIEVLQ